MCQYCGPLLKAIDAYLIKADDDLADALDAEGYAEPDETVKAANTLEDGIADALEKETGRVVAGLKSSKDLKTFAKKVWPKIKGKDLVNEDIAEVVSTLLRKYVPHYTGIYIKATDKALTCTRLSKRATAWIDSWAKDLGDLMKLNSHNEIQSILDKGLTEGVGVEEFTRRLLESGIRDERYKARRASLTEVLTAHRVAQQEAFMQSPSVEKKRWLHTGSYRNQPRPNHEDMDGQTVPVASPYTLQGADGETYYPMYPGDTSLPAGERINCHCISEPIVNADVLGLSIEEREQLQQQALDDMDDEWMAELDAQNKAKAGIEDE